MPGECSQHKLFEHLIHVKTYPFMWLEMMVNDFSLQHRSQVMVVDLVYKSQGFFSCGPWPHLNVVDVLILKVLHTFLEKNEVLFKWSVFFKYLHSAVPHLVHKMAHSALRHTLNYIIKKSPIFRTNWANWSGGLTDGARKSSLFLWEYTELRVAHTTLLPLACVTYRKHTFTLHQPV